LSSPIVETRRLTTRGIKALITTDKKRKKMTVEGLQTV